MTVVQRFEIAGNLLTTEFFAMIQAQAQQATAAGIAAYGNRQARRAMNGFN